MTLQHKFTLIDDVSIHYVESLPLVKGDLTTLIFLHGFPEYWATWRHQLEYFSKQYRVIAPDLPGYNLSDKPVVTRFYAVPNLISFFASFIQQMCPKQKVILIAHDWGGAIAWPLTAFHPQLVKKLIILNAAHPSTFTREMVTNPQQMKKSAYIHQLISGSGEQVLSCNNFEFLSDKMMVSPQEGVFTAAIKARYRAVWSQPGAINGMLQYYRAMPQLAPSSDTQQQSVQPSTASPLKSLSDIKIPNIRIHVPTLILWGEQDDAFVNENLDGIEQYVTNCTVVRFPKCSHWLQHEVSDDINKAVNSFI
ncbi:alpha/beta fold hydrolase [Shewanella youngdeokensis]|uniref:Alpha/beta hydrolase n=1 Tax=Shewanella youngdeokensis TaxID=2999068 RepID=A0ABZ0JT90_9GAMM|nr:alpha/beta hydrolase [Shewanella sp. DAU334]